MRMKLNIGPILFLALLLNACGDEETRPPVNHDSTQLPTVSTLAPRTYSFANARCQQHSGAGSLNAATIEADKGFGLEPVRLKLSGIRSDDTLNNAAVKKTIAAELYSRNCAFGSLKDDRCFDNSGQSIPWQLSDRQLKDWPAATMLKICESEPEVTRDTFEQAALLALTTLQESQANLQRATGRFIPPVDELLIFPIFESVFANTPEGKNTAVYRTNNLSYFPKQNATSTNAIAILPDTSDAASPYGEMHHLWESSFVIGHEFGHHVEFQILGELQKDNAVSAWSPMEHRWLPHHADGATPAVDKISFVSSAVSEGFADLYGVYSGPANSAGLQQFPCFNLNRNIKQPSFAGGKPKILNSEIIQQIFGSGSKRLVQNLTSGECATPAQLAGYHHLGAILAHQIDKAATIYLNLPSQRPHTKLQNNDHLKLQILIAWIQKYRSTKAPERLSLVQEESLLQQTLAAFEESLLDYSQDRFAALTAEDRVTLCRALVDGAPALKRRDYFHTEAPCRP